MSGGNTYAGGLGIRSADPGQIGGLEMGGQAILPGPESRAPLSLGMVFLVLFTMITVGRIADPFPFLWPLRLGLVTGGIALLFWMFSPSSLREKIPTEIPQVKYVLMLLGLAVVLIPLSVWPGNSFWFVTEGHIKSVLLFLLVIYWCRSYQDIRRLIWACCLGVIGLMVSGLFITHALRSDGRFSAGSTNYDPNDLALVLATLLPMMLFLLTSKRPLVKLAVGGMVALSIHGIILTQSRGGFVALVAVGSLIIFRSKLNRSIKFFGVAISVLVFVILAGSAFWDRIETIWNPQTEYDLTLGDRTQIWGNALNLMVEYPWGTGPGSFRIAEGLSHGGKGVWNAPHNTYLQVGVELGIAGLGVFLVLLVRTLNDLRRLQGNFNGTRAYRGVSELASTLEISLWGFIVGAFFLSQAYSMLLYFLLGLSLAFLRLAWSPLRTAKPELKELG